MILASTSIGCEPGWKSKRDTICTLVASLYSLKQVASGRLPFGLSTALPARSCHSAYKSGAGALLLRGLAVISGSRQSPPGVSVLQLKKPNLIFRQNTYRTLQVQTILNLGLDVVEAHGGARACVLDRAFTKVVNKQGLPFNPIVTSQPRTVEKWDLYVVKI